MSTITPVTVYSKPACVGCTAVKRKLTEKGVPFTEESLLDEANLEAAKALGHMQAPVVIHGEFHFSGYNPGEVEALVLRHRAEVDAIIEEANAA